MDINKEINYTKYLKNGGSNFNIKINLNLTKSFLNTIKLQLFPFK